MPEVTFDTEGEAAAGRNARRSREQVGRAAASLRRELTQGAAPPRVNEAQGMLDRALGLYAITLDATGVQWRSRDIDAEEGA